MAWFGELWRRARMILGRQRFDRELRDEMELHRELKEQELVRSGVAPEEARFAASRSFGNSLEIRERGREAWGWMRTEELARDLRFGARLLARSPGFLATAVLTLALGIGANTAIFSLVHALLIRPLPFRDARELVVVTGRTSQMDQTGISYPDLEDWRRENQSLAGISAWMSQSVNLTGEGRPDRVRGGFVSANFFDLLGVAPERGRVFLPGEDQPGAGRTVVVNHGVWQTRFGGDPDFIGKRLILNGSVFTVIGILPPAFEFPLDADRIEVWLPVSSYPNFKNDRAVNSLIGIARMKPEVPLTQARADISEIARRLAQAYPDTNGQRGTTVRPLQELVAQDFRPVLLVLLSAVAFVLLIASANVANLLLARGAARVKEIRLRAALGASRRRLVQQILTETMILWFLGGALGLLVGTAGLRVLLLTAPMKVPPGIAVETSGAVLLFTLGITLGAGLAAGIGPALAVSRGERPLAEGGRTAGDSPGAVRLRGVLLVSQVALSLLLLTGAGLMIQTVARLAGTSPGFNPRNLLTLEYRLPQTQYAKPDQQLAFHERVLERVGQIPGVQSATVALGLPFSGNFGSEPLILLDRPLPSPGQEPVVETHAADWHYFETLGIPLVAGRTFAESDRMPAPRVAVISQTMAMKYWPKGDALGRQLELLDRKEPATIIGVVGDTRQSGLDQPPAAQLYFAYHQNPYRFASLAVRTSREPMGLARAVRDAVWSVDKDQPVWKVRSLEAMMDISTGDRRYLAYLLSTYAGLALVLAAVGIHGVLSYSVGRRMKELGVRAALGAQPRDALRLVLGDGMKKIALGLVFGLAGAIGLTRLMSGLLFAVAPTDPWTLAGASAVLAGAGLVACWIPARRATRVDPVVMLRHE